MIDREREMRSPVATVLGTMLLAAYLLDFKNHLSTLTLVARALVHVPLGDRQAGHSPAHVCACAPASIRSVLPTRVLVISTTACRSPCVLVAVRCLVPLVSSRRLSRLGYSTFRSARGCLSGLVLGSGHGWSARRVTRFGLRISLTGEVARYFVCHCSDIRSSEYQCTCITRNSLIIALALLFSRSLR